MHVKDLLVESGLQETITYRLTAPEREARLLPGSSGVQPDDRPYLALANPITIDRVAMRHSLLASVLEIVAGNSRFRNHIAVFELGHIYLASEEGVLPDELRRLALVLMGARERAHWAEDASANLDFFDLKGIIENLLATLQIQNWHFEAGNHPSFRPGRTAALLLGERQVGYVGELHPLVIETYDIRRTTHGQAVLAAELDLDVLLTAVPEGFRIEPTPSFPGIHEDLALIVDRAVPAAEMTGAIAEAGGFLLKRVELFDIYEGEQIPSGKKSLAYHLTFMSPTKTLRDRDVRKSRSRILQQLSRQFGAHLRE